MPFGLRLSLLLLIAGCAERALVVPDSDWRTVPAAQRDALDRRNEAELTAARAELASAQASLATFQRAPAPPRAAPARAPAAADGDDTLAKLDREQEQARIEALGRVEAATEEKQRADLAWRRLWVDAASAQVEMVAARRELTRAQTIDRYMPGNDSYDTAPLRGQFSRAQQRWYAISRSARAARDAFERTSAFLASAKEAYAQLMRTGPIRLPDANDRADRAARLELPGWSITRSDLRRRRGPRHLLGPAGSTPQLRKVAIQLSPALRARANTAAKSPSPSSPLPSVAPVAKKPPAEANRGIAPKTEHPADRAAKASAPAVSAGKPGAPRAGSPPPQAVDHPADRAGNRSAPMTAVNRPAEARSPSPAPRTDRTGKPGAIEASPAAVSQTTTGKPAEAPRGAVSPTTAASTRSAEHPAASSTVPASQASGSPHGSAASGSTRAAKPVERPLSEGDAH